MAYRNYAAGPQETRASKVLSFSEYYSERCAASLCSGKILELAEKSLICVHQ